MKIKIAENVYWVGAIDWNVRHFHGHTYTTHRGSTYNAYLILDEKIALVDTVPAAFTEEMIDRIRELINPADIDFVIANHGEMDHSGAISAVMDLAPEAKLVGTAKVQETLGRYFGRRRLAQFLTLGPAVGALFVRSYERAERVWAAMLSRGYDPNKI